MDIHLDIRCMFLLVCIEQNMNNAKAGIGPMVIIFSNQWLARPGEKAVASSLLLADRRKNDPLPVFVVCRALMAAQWEMAVRKTSKSIFAAAALAAAMSFNIPAGHAAGWRHEPWCAFFEYDDVTVDCSYRTFEECYPNVIGGIRGTCGPNPDGPGVSAAAPAEAHKQHKHRAQQ
jgi:hypothetical protein